ncbi:MAG: tetratricopeptide repeat protein [Gemmatimonadetes bacterium]|nr:tetratricopeptide repeat protein [Gemmatimonadota bacterium]
MRCIAILFVLGLLVPCPSVAQNPDAPVCASPASPASALSGAARWADSARREIDQAHATSDLERVAGVRVLLERALTAYPGAAWLHYYTGLAYYREATARFGRDGTDVGELLDRAESALETSLDLAATPDARGLLASVLGQKIGSNPFRGMTLGPRSGRLMDEARKEAPDNPRLWLLGGIGAIFTPGMFGGGLDRAERELLRAIELFRTDAPAPPAPSWGCAEAWLWLGQVYQRQKKIGEARSAYETALRLEPDNAWIRDVLLPGVSRNP